MQINCKCSGGGTERSSQGKNACHITGLFNIVLYLTKLSDFPQLLKPRGLQAEPNPIILRKAKSEVDSTEQINSNS